MNVLIGHLASVRRAITQVANTSATVLILGETGTGKECVARELHAQSSHAGQPFVPVNCGAFVPALIASELFGHEAGAFTGAANRRIGRFEQAHRGTLFLDEVAELPTEAQAMLLRVLQERVVERVGGSTSLAINVRLIAATNRDLLQAVRSGAFREDLYYRLNVFPISLPPLRERKADIAELAEHFLSHFAKFHRKPARRITSRTLELLQQYDWPGNVRELQNIIERAVIISESEELVVDEGWFVHQPKSETARTWAEQEKTRILAALRDSGGRIYGPGGAAHRLGLKPTTLYGKMRKHGLKREADWL